MRALALGCALLVSIAGAATAQAPQTSGGSADAAATAARSRTTGPAAEAHRDQIRARLRMLVAAQERYWSTHGTYTTDLAALGLYSAPAAQAAGASDSVSVQVIFAGGAGWTASGAHRAEPGRSCVMYVGVPENLPRLPVTRAAKQAAAEEAVPTCDAF